MEVQKWVGPPLSACQVWWGPGSDLLYQHAKYGGDLGRTSSISMPSMVGTWVRPPLSACQVWWGPGSRASCRQKVWCFLSVFLSCFGMMKFVITKTLWSSVIFRTIMVLLNIGRFLVVHLCSSFPIDPQNFSWGAHFYEKLSFFGNFWGRKATFLKLQRLNLAWNCGPGAPSPRQNIVIIG